VNLALIEEAASRTLPGILPGEVARSVDALSAAYLGKRAAVPAKSVLPAKLLFYGVADAPKLGILLGELAAGGALPVGHHWNVLDLGAGPGVTSLALREWLRSRGFRPHLRLRAVDQDDLALAAGERLHEAYATLAGESAPGVSYEPLHRDLERAWPPAGSFDLILAANLLNELWRGEMAPEPRRAALLAYLVRETLAGSGSLCILEPALRQQARALHRVRDLLLEQGSATVYAPCLRGAPCPMLAGERDWCHEDRPGDLPERTRLVARLAGLRRHSLKFSYLVLRRDGRKLADAFPEARFRVVSELLRHKGKEEAFLCGPGGRLRLLRNRRHQSPANAAFTELCRGRLACIEPEEFCVGPETRVAVWDPLLFGPEDRPCPLAAKPSPA
jgi:SAM-dependent methyltransferase